METNYENQQLTITYIIPHYKVAYHGARKIIHKCDKFMAKVLNGITERAAQIGLMASGEALYEKL